MQAVWQRFLSMNPAWKELVVEVETISEDAEVVDYTGIANKLPLFDWN